MMNKNIIILLLCLIGSGLHAQGIQFETGSWNGVIAKAKQENRLIYLDIYASWCGPCKMMAAKYFPTPDAGSKYNAAFVNYKMDAEKGEGIEIAKRYKVTAYPTNLYINPATLEIVYKAVGAPSTLAEFVDRADIAQAEFNDPMKWADYQKQFKSGNIDKSFLEKYIAKAIVKEEDNDPALNKYVTQFVKDPTDEDLEFLLKNTRTFDNSAVNLLAKNRNRINELHQEESPDYFNDWIQQLPYYTVQKAIQDQDESLLEVVDKSMVQYNLPRGILGKYAFLEYYFQGIGDKEKAAVIAKDLSNYLSGLSSEAYARENEASLKEIKEKINLQVKAQGLPDSMKKTVFASTLEAHPEYALIANATAAQELNKNAWKVVELEKRGAVELSDALKWSKKSLDLAAQLQEWPMYADTYAHLLYFNNQKKEAIATQERAIQKAKEHQQDGLADMEESLGKMKSGSL